MKASFDSDRLWAMTRFGADIMGRLLVVLVIVMAAMVWLIFEPLYEVGKRFGDGKN